MPDSYKLQYDGKIVTYPDWNGYVAYEGISPYNITYTNDGHGTVTGPLSAYGGDVVTLTSTPNQYYISNGYDVTGGIINGNDLTVNDECTVYGKFTLQNSALLYTNNTETVSTALTRSFSVSVPTAFPYVAIRFDWCDSHPRIWAYNRTVCGIEVRAHYAYSPGLQKVCKPQNNSSAMNAATLYNADGGADIAANSTTATTYTTVNYAWHNHSTGFSAAVAGTWRYRDARSNNISTLSNITCENEQTASQYRCTFKCKNVRVACFKNAADCLKTTW